MRKPHFINKKVFQKSFHAKNSETGDKIKKAPQSETPTRAKAEMCPIGKRISADGTPLARGGFCGGYFVYSVWRVLVWRRGAPPLVQDKHTPKCQSD